MAWATTSSLTEAKQLLAGCGTTSAALCFGGYTGGGVDTTEIWSGTAWATTTSLIEAKWAFAGCGTSSAALCFGGYISGGIDTTEIWSGTAWATTTSLTEDKYSLAGCGTTSAALCFGGNTDAAVSTTEIWSGTAWATTTSLTEAKNYLAGCGTTSAALCFGGNTGVSGYFSTTEIWQVSVLSGVVCDKNGSFVTEACNIDIYNKDVRDSRVGTAVSNPSDGSWSSNLGDIEVGTKCLVLFSYEGDYGGDTDIAGAEYLVSEQE